MISTRENVLISADGNIPRYMCCISSNNPIIEITEVMKQGKKIFKMKSSSIFSKYQKD